MLKCESQGFFIIANENTSWHGCLPPQLAPSACTLVWTDEGAGSLGAGSWGVSSWVGRNAEHRSVSRACSFNKEFCRQKQNIGLDREQQDSAITLQLPEPISSACKGVLFHWQLCEDVRESKCALLHEFLDFWLFKSQFEWIIPDTWERWIRQQKMLYSRKPNWDGIPFLGPEAIH